jgi:uncharacterized protein (DUF4415 family)
MKTTNRKTNAVKPNAVKPHAMRPNARRRPGTAATEGQRRQLAALAKMPESAIDVSDAPELVGAAKWKDAVRGRFYRPVKQAVSLRLDADVIAWLKKDGEGYQTRANQMLRERMLKDIGL